MLSSKVQNTKNATTKLRNPQHDMDEPAKAESGSLVDLRQPTMTKQRPPRPRTKSPLSQSNRAPTNWRDDCSQDRTGSSLSSSLTKSSSVSSSRSSGICPSSFHPSVHDDDEHPSSSSSPSVRRPRALAQALSRACTTVVRQRRSHVTTHLRVRRAAFKDETSLHTWPLQDMALRDFAYWSLVHYSNDDTTTTTDNATLQQQHEQRQPTAAAPTVETHGDSSTGLSSSSLDEPKRLRRQPTVSADHALSPRKSTLRHQFALDFRKERMIPQGITLGESRITKDFQSALWCMEPRIFAVEKSHQGKRKYMVGHMGRFCDYYWRKTDATSRHFYELIREKTPCRLYFDLEFVKAANREITDDTSELLLDEFRAELILEFHRHHGVTMDRSCIVDLDSSTPTKFSRHWIVHLPNKALFADAGAAGRFVRVLIGRLAEEQATGQLHETRPTLAKHLFVNVERKNTSDGSGDATSGESATQDTAPPPSSGHMPASSQRSTDQQDSARLDFANKTCFVDMGVYTRNRLFRLLGSCKFGKPPSAALRIAANNTYPFPENFGNNSFYVPAMEKSQMRDKENATAPEAKVDMDEDMKRFLSAVDWTDHATALVDTLVVPMNGSKIVFPILQDSEDTKALCGTGDDSLDSAIPPSTATLSRPGIGRSNSVSMGTSPFPAVDEFVLNVLAKRGGVDGAIRAWSVEDSTDPDSPLPLSITYQMSRNRWCERIGRAHRSNNIMWTVDLVSMACTQSCHDPECRMMHFRGVPVPLPRDVQEGLEDAAFERQLALLDEAALLEGRNIERPTACAQQRDEFDDAEFEKALLALNIDGHDLVRSRKEWPGQHEDVKETSTARAPFPETNLLAKSDLFS